MGEENKINNKNVFEFNRNYKIKLMNILMLMKVQLM